MTRWTCACELTHAIDDMCISPSASWMCESWIDQNIDSSPVDRQIRFSLSLLLLLMLFFWLLIRVQRCERWDSSIDEISSLKLHFQESSMLFVCLEFCQWKGFFSSNMFDREEKKRHHYWCFTSIDYRTDSIKRQCSSLSLSFVHFTNRVEHEENFRHFINFVHDDDDDDVREQRATKDKFFVHFSTFSSLIIKNDWWDLFIIEQFDD